MAEELKYIASVSGFDKVEKGLKNQTKALKETESAADKTNAAYTRTGNIFAAKLPESIKKTTLELNKVPQALNKIPPSLESVKATATKLASSLGEVGAGVSDVIAEFGGLSIGALVVGGAIKVISEHFKELEERQAKVTISQRLFNDVLNNSGDAYVKAVTDVNNLRVAFRQAEAGIITKEEALKLYNNTIGKTTGEVKSLDEAERALIKNADAYIEFTLLKSAANVAASKSAQKLFESISESRKVLEPKGQRKRDIFGFKFSEERLEEFASKERSIFAAGKRQRVDALKDESDVYKSIYEEFLTQAEALAAKFKFDFNGIKPPVERAKKEVEKFFKAVRFKPDKIEFIDPDQFNRDLIEALEKIKGQTDVFFQVPVKIEPTISTDNLADLKRGEEEAFLLGQGYKEAFVKGMLNPDLSQFVKGLKEKFAELGANISKIISSTIGDALSGLAEGLGEIIGGAAGGIGNIFKGLLNVMGAGLSAIGKALVQYGIAKKIIETLNISGTAAILIGLGLQVFAAALKKKLSFNSFATGGRNVDGGSAIVGERGREIVQLPRGANVIPANQTSAILGGQHITLGGHVDFNGQTLRVVLKRADEQASRNGF